MEMEFCKCRLDFQNNRGLPRAGIIHLIFMKSLLTSANAELLLELEWSEKKLLKFSTDRPTELTADLLKVPI
jgi:hypothetical protein